MCSSATVAPSTDSPAEAWLRSISPATEHHCFPTVARRVRMAARRGYHEAFHEAHLAMADAPAAVLRRFGFQTLVELATEGWLVLAKATPIAPWHEDDPALDPSSSFRPVDGAGDVSPMDSGE
jgi:hypothetical protein